jgi:hypothetical protein
MTGFSALNRQCMGRFEALRPMLSDFRPGHLWTGRLELWSIIETIDDWISANGLDFEAVALRDYFRSLPATSYTREPCTAALKAKPKTGARKSTAPASIPAAKIRMIETLKAYLSQPRDTARLLFYAP